MPVRIVTFSLFVLIVVCLYACSGNQQDGKRIRQEGGKVFGDTIAGEAYEALQQFAAAEAKGKPVMPNSLKQVVILTEQAKLHQRIESDTLTAYIRRTENLVLDHMTGSKDTGEVLIQFALLPKRRPDIKLSYKGKLNPNSLNQLRLDLNASAGWFRTIKDSCVYQLHFLVNIPKAQ